MWREHRRHLDGIATEPLGWIKRLFTAWRVSHAERTERRAERKEAGEEDSEEGETPVVIPSSAVTIHPKGTPAPTSSVEVQVSVRRESGPEQRYDLAANDRSGRQNTEESSLPLARGELDKLEGPKYAARRAELRRKAGEAARARDRQAAAASQDEAEWQTRATRQRRKRQEGERREWDDRERWHERLQRESARDCEGR